MPHERLVSIRDRMVRSTVLVTSFFSYHKLPVKRNVTAVHAPGPRARELRGSPECGVYGFRLSSVERHQMDEIILYGRTVMRP